MPFNEQDRTRGTSFFELREALAQNPRQFDVGGQIDASTTIHISGCNIGRNRAFVELLGQAFGGGSHLEAPTHRLHFEAGPQPDRVRAYFVDYTIERPGNWHAAPRDLEAEFTTRYPQLIGRWSQLRSRVRRRLVTQRLPGNAEPPVDDSMRAEAVRRGRDMVGDPDRYSWSTTVGRPRGREVPVSAVATRTEYFIPGEITGPTAGPTFNTEVGGSRLGQTGRRANQ